ncbi:integral membrane protein, partial [Metarhizium brunneum ARSEF 3297]
MAREPLHQLPREPWYTRGGGPVPRAPLIMWSLCRKLVASLALISCAVWYAQTHFYRDPGSRFFDPSRAYEQKYSRHRRAEVQQFIEQYASAGAAHDAPTRGESGAGRSLCVTFTSVRRQRIQYVETAVASALGNLLPQERADAEHLETLEDKREFAEKGVFDYIYALEACAQTDTPYIGILEDDVLLADGWLARALLGLRDISNCGKASVWPPSRGVVDEPFGCCSQVMVFPREQVASLVRFLGTRRGQVDLLLNEWAEEAGLARYALYPVMAQHMGVDSARGTVVDEAQAIWSMAFEDLEPARLDRDHRRMVKEYYGG